MKSDNEKMLCWAVKCKCIAKNNGVMEEFTSITAIFLYPFQAEEFIQKIIPDETRDRFYVEYIEREVCNED